MFVVKGYNWYVMVCGFVCYVYWGFIKGVLLIELVFIYDCQCGIVKMVVGVKQFQYQVNVWMQCGVGIGDKCSFYIVCGFGVGLFVDVEFEGLCKQLVIMCYFCFQFVECCFVCVFLCFIYSGGVMFVKQRVSDIVGGLYFVLLQMWVQIV